MIPATLSWDGTTRQRRAPSFTRAKPVTLGRIFAAQGSFVVLLIDPPQFSIAPELVIPGLLAYLAFAAGVLGWEVRGGTPSRELDWMDLGFGLLLTCLTGGTVSIAFLLLLLPIIARSFRDGFEAGWSITWITILLYLALGLPASPGGESFELGRSLIRPWFVLALGYIFAREGGQHRRARRQLELLAELNTVANPRFGVDRTLLNAVQKIRLAYGVRECLILLPRSSTSCMAVRCTPTTSASEKVPLPAVASLLALPRDTMVLSEPSRRIGLGGPVDQNLWDQAEVVADLVDARAFASVPAMGTNPGRLFLIDDALTQIDETELRFLAQAAKSLLHIVEKVELLDQLATLAAERERRRLAHDLHDRAIQPYLGLQLGITAAMRRPDCPPAVADDLQGLLSLWQQGVDELRRLLDGQSPAPLHHTMLTDSVDHLATRFREEFELEVSYEIEPGLRLTDRFAADVVSMISEALSNVRRHTRSPWVRVRVYAEGDALSVLVVNRRDRKWTPFTPRSLADRAGELGGEVQVVASDAQETTVRIRVPL